MKYTTAKSRYLHPNESASDFVWIFLVSFFNVLNHFFLRVLPRWCDAPRNTLYNIANSCSLVTFSVISKATELTHKVYFKNLITVSLGFTLATMTALTYCFISGFICLRFVLHHACGRSNEENSYLDSEKHLMQARYKKFNLV